MNYDKLSPALAATLDDFDVSGRAALETHAGFLGLVSVEPTVKPPRVVVFLHTAEEVATDRWESLGVRVNAARRGGVRTGIVPLDSLAALTDDPVVERLIPADRLELCMDVAAAHVSIPQFRAAGGLSGAGVVVGVVDSGINAAHPAFAGRVDRIWDQTLPGPGVPEGDYGVELTGNLLSVSQDTVGHGTHVAGIAAGDDEPWSGVAPGAVLVVVKTDLMTAHIADGVRYVFRVAEEMGLPAVVNLSLGGHGDAHDGTDPLSQVIDDESGPGRIVCCAAGNDGEANIHAQVVVPKGRTRTVSASIPLPPPDRPPGVSVINGWYPDDAELELAVVGPSGTQTDWQGPITTGSPAVTYNISDGSVRVTTPGPDPSNGDHSFLIQILPAPGSTAPQPDRWRIRIRGREAAGHGARVDMWFLNRPAQFSGRYVQDGTKVGSPGAATSAITVAAYTTRVEWVDILGTVRGTGADLNDIAEFSSEGPRRDEAEKPDVAAPGSMIASALSAHATRPQALLLDGFHTMMQGTSMACPFVSGIVALLLERDGSLDPDTVKSMLKKAAAIPGEGAGTYDPHWGYGLVDAAHL